MPALRWAYSIDCDRAYVIQTSKDGYIQNTFPVDKTKGGSTNVTADLVPVETLIVGDVINLNEIYFEFDKSNITQEGAFELDRIVEIMKANPSIEIMVRSHTDTRGTDEYNMSLSNRRAKSTIQYIISKGISQDRISGQGYGESQPKVNCGADCTEEQHAQNRRSEFMIVKK